MHVCLEIDENLHSPQSACKAASQQQALFSGPCASKYFMESVLAALAVDSFLSKRPSPHHPRIL